MKIQIEVDSEQCSMLQADTMLVVLKPTDIIRVAEGKIKGEMTGASLQKQYNGKNSGLVQITR